MYFSTDAEIGVAIASGENDAFRLIVIFYAMEMIVLRGTVRNLPTVPIGASVF